MMLRRVYPGPVGLHSLFLKGSATGHRCPHACAAPLITKYVPGHVRGPKGLRHVVFVCELHGTSLVYTAPMLTSEQFYVSGGDAALASFGLMKLAVIMNPAQQAAFMKARGARPTGMAAVGGAAGDAELVRAKPLPGAPAPVALPAPGGPMHVEQGFGGGPGMAQGFRGPDRSVPMETDLRQAHNQAALGGELPSRRLPQAMTGVQSIPGQATIAQRMATRGGAPGPIPLPARLASLLLPWPE